MGQRQYISSHINLTGLCNIFYSLTGSSSLVFFFVPHPTPPLCAAAAASQLSCSDKHVSVMQKHAASGSLPLLRRGAGEESALITYHNTTATQVQPSEAPIDCLIDFKLAPLQQLTRVLGRFFAQAIFLSGFLLAPANPCKALNKGFLRSANCFLASCLRSGK